MKLFKNYGIALAAMAATLLRSGETILINTGLRTEPHQVTKIKRGGKLRLKGSRYLGPGYGTGFARRVALKRKYVI